MCERQCNKRGLRIKQKRDSYRCLLRTGVNEGQTPEPRINLLLEPGASTCVRIILSRARSKVQLVSNILPRDGYYRGNSFTMQPLVVFKTVYEPLLSKISKHLLSNVQIPVDTLASARHQRNRQNIILSRDGDWRGLEGRQRNCGTHRTFEPVQVRDSQRQARSRESAKAHGTCHRQCRTQARRETRRMKEPKFTKRRNWLEAKRTLAKLKEEKMTKVA